MPRHLAVLILAAIAGACKTGRDYPEMHEPRYAGAPPVNNVGLVPPDTLRVVTFNIAFARHIDSALVLLRAEPELRSPDVLTLQEMDASGTKRIADALGMFYVYYPALFHSRTRRDFGNAVLSRWPITSDAKILLPHPSRYAGTHRIATAATIAIGGLSIRVYSTHLGTLADVGGAGREEQLRAILLDAREYDHVIIAGDMNSSRIGQLAQDSGYVWPTQKGPRTTQLGRWDHIYIRGLRLPDSARTGTIRDARGSSDHRPVWLRLLLPDSARSRK